MFKQTRHLVKIGLGKLLCSLLPHRKRAMLESFTLPYWDERLKLDVVDRLIRYSISNYLQTEKNTLENVHRDFWRAERSAAWYPATNHRLLQLYIPTYGKFVDEVASKLESLSIDSLVEFGTGDGSWLNYLSTRLDRIKNFTGVDLCQTQISKNRSAWPDIRFECDDLVAWLRRKPKDRTLYHTNSGVLEYLSEQSVLEVLSLIKRKSQGGAIFFIEPVSMEYDLESARVSLPLGPELSFSHNYRYMLESLGYTIQLYSEIIAEPYRNVVVLAKA